MELTDGTELTEALLDYEAASFIFKAKQIRVNQLSGLKKKKKKGYSVGTYSNVYTWFA